MDYDDKKRLKYGIIGTGAVGGYYGALLARSGLDVHFLLRSDYEHVKLNGLVIESKDGDFTLPVVNAYSTPSIMPKLDVVIIALKTTGNHQLPLILPSLIHEDTVIVVLQNGLDIEKDIARIVPTATIIGGLCFLCSNKKGPGHIHHLDFGSVRLGEYSSDRKTSGITQKLRMIADAFESAGIEIVLTENLGKARWEKLVWNMAYNGLSVILKATTDQMMNNPSTLDLIREIMFEVIQGAQACGYHIEKEFIDKMIKTTEKMVRYSPSMKLDYEAGRRLEVDGIYRRPINTAHANGFQMTRSTVIADMLEYLDSIHS